MNPNEDRKNTPIMTDTFSKFSMVVKMLDQQARAVAITLVDRWFYSCNIPSRIYRDQGKNFKNKIIKQLHILYCVKQSTTIPYNPYRNLICKQFNKMLHNLLKTLPNEHKTNCPAHLTALVFIYSVTPHATGVHQPYYLLCGCKAQTP